MPRLTVVAALLLAAGAAMAAAPVTELRVCADPNALPHSNEQRQGFENAIVELLAADLGRTVRYTWWAQRRGFIRNTLRAGDCDVVAGVPAGYELTLTTAPYYRSTYVFVQRADATPPVRSLDDPALTRLRVGVQLIGDDGVNTPPAHALTARGIVDNVRGFLVYGDYAQPSPAAAIVHAVSAGDLDVALVWGPLAGYFARRSPVPLVVAPLAPAAEPPLTFVFDIAMGVRRADRALRDELDAALVRRRDDIRRILDRYGVPIADPGAPSR
jgi:quinoprotein dehydrogenase-associated probable ABC transporter substrate-binding protein